MKFEKIEKTDNEYVMHTYGKLPVCFVKGEGVYLFDTEGKKYLDFLSGLGVNMLGHCHPDITKALKKQAKTLLRFPKMTRNGSSSSPNRTHNS